MHISAHAVAILKTGHFATVAFHFGGLCVQDDIDVLQAADFILQDLIGLHLWGELQQRDVLDDTGEVDSRFHTRVTPPITATRLPLNSGPSQCGQ